MIRYFVTCFFCLTSYFLVSQINALTNKSKKNICFEFIAHPNQKYGFDSYEYEAWKNNYTTIQSTTISPFFYSYKLVNYKDRDQVLLLVKGIKKINSANLKILNRNQNVNYTRFNDSTFSVNLPPKKSDYTITVFWKNRIVSKLYVQVKKEVREKILIVPIVELNLSQNKIQEKINAIYKQANIQFDVTKTPSFSSKVFEPNTIFSTPSENHSQYSGQMRLIRDLFFESHPKIDRNTHVIFLIKGFSDSLLKGYMVKNKSIAFVKNQNNIDSLSIQIARTLGFGVGALDDSWSKNGPSKGSTKNLMDTTEGTHLTFFQWNGIHKMSNYYSFYDNEENIKTNNGTVAYFFWEETSKGNIKFHNNTLLNALKRPYKKNFLSYRFKVKYFILKPFYKVGSYFVSILDIIFLLLIGISLWYIRIRLKRLWVKKKFRFHFIRRIIFLFTILLIVFFVYDNYWVTNRILYYFKQISGPLKELNQLNYTSAQKELLVNQKLLHQEVPTVCSEILIKRNNKWFIKKRASVLYFNVVVRDNKNIKKIRFVSSSDSINLSTLNYHKKAMGHYLVFNYVNSKDSLQSQKVFDYSGEEISSKFSQQDVPKRILLFVNGYRPTSIGQTFEENFSDVQNNGFEYANSQNFIYDFDRFDYWKPWNEINLRFQKRLNPNETYYADGHFSVETSNYRSLINFTSVSTLFPKRCPNPLKHRCHYIQNATIKQFLFNQSKSINQLKMRPNRRGFNLRKSKGRIAGKNLLQIINKIPDFSKNDTLYIVAHSMGFAYSLGMIEELRDKINFGGYYIIAPENPKSGYVNPVEWKEIWQYGSNLDQIKYDPPCLQDGIAPQTKITGLPSNKRVFIPKKLYSCKGFFDSHFIGYYTWILEIKKDSLGYVTKK